VQAAFATYFPRARTVLINSDGGSTDGTPALVRDRAADEAGTVTMSHSLRTAHRISSPYHGVPGKGNALRQILAAADLTQASAAVVLDAEVVSVTPEWIAALIGPVKDQQYDYVAPIYARHPLDGPLVTQLVRPLMRSAYGWQIREPLAAEFSFSNGLAAYLLEQDVWGQELARDGIDVWVTGAALAGNFRCGQAPLGPRTVGQGHVPLGFQEVFQQVVGAAFGCIELHEAYCLNRGAAEPLPVVGPFPDVTVNRPTVDGSRLTQSFCDDLRNLQGVLEPILSVETLSTLNQIAQAECERFHYPDQLWVSTVYEFLAAHRDGVMRRDHIAQALVPLYRGRAGSFLTQYAAADPADVDAALESLCLQFERSKPELVERWNQTNPR